MLLTIMSFEARIYVCVCQLEALIHAYLYRRVPTSRVLLIHISVLNPCFMCFYDDGGVCFYDDGGDDQ